MVLKDGVFEQMDYENFSMAVNLKVRSVLSLSKAVNGLDLDFFCYDKLHFHHTG